MLLSEADVNRYWLETTGRILVPTIFPHDPGEKVCIAYDGNCSSS